MDLLNTSSIVAACSSIGRVDEMKNCVQCGREYEPAWNKPHQQLCSYECRLAADRLPPRTEKDAKACERCGESFIPALKHANQRYCSMKCIRDAWREAHPGCVAQWYRTRCAKDPDGVKEYFKKYRTEHPEAGRAANARWSRAHPDKRREQLAKRKARKLSALVEMTPEQRAAMARVYAAAANEKRVRCYLCGKWIPMGKRHVDHIVPLSKGGKHMASNLAVACAFCNVSKNAKMPAEVGVLV